MPSAAAKTSLSAASITAATTIPSVSVAATTLASATTAAIASVLEGMGITVLQEMALTRAYWCPLHRVDAHVV